jgi:hypothetical protein
VEQDAGGGEAAQTKALRSARYLFATPLEISAQDLLRKIIIRLSFAQFVSQAISCEDAPPINPPPDSMSLTNVSFAAPPGSPPR